MTYSKSSQPVSKAFRALVLAGAVVMFVLFVTGGLVRVTGAGGACPDWPTCFGQWMPPSGASAGVQASLDWTHRFTTFLVSPLILLAAGVALLRYRREKWLVGTLWSASALLLAQIGLGAIVAGQGEVTGRSWVSALHLALSLLTQAALVAAAVVAFYRSNPLTQAGGMRFRSPFGRWSLWTLGAFFVLLVTGALVAGSDAGMACTSWPLCGVPLASMTPEGWVQVIHRLSVALTGILVGALFWKAWRTQRSHAPILVASTALFVLFLAQALLGAKMVQGFPAYLLVLHAATAAAAWVAMIVQVSAVGMAARTLAEEQTDAASIVGRRGLAKDLLLLTKPIVVALLLVTTYAGMVIGAQSWPSLSVTFWTMLGGFMAAGGSGAINQYIDRYDDGKMQRTQKRPIPAGRLTAAEGLAFGVGLTLASFYLMVAFTNLLAALLSLAGIFYYVLLYSVFLKKTTVQNIVIGGGAGAIPPLVGWAAATGSLNIPSLFLFAVVFLWTPPHFWALALVRRKDYARAGVPMLPVIRGEAETRWQIFLYTLELVALTLLLPLFGLGGAIYLVGAGLLGAWLTLAAWKVWKGEGNKTAWKMYRYSSMYLAFLFLVLMVDRLM